MRNVPVGAGRRKNKSTSVSHFRQIMISEALRSGQTNVPNGIHNPSFGNNGTVLTFGSDSPLCESVASVLNLTGKTQNCMRNGFHRPEQRNLPSLGGRSNGDDHSSGSSITASNSSEKGGTSASQDVRIKNYQDSAPQVPYFPGPPWPYPWNTPMPPPPAFYPPGFPVSFYPETAYWSCAIPGPWNMPCVSPNSSSLTHCAPNSTPATPTLGKHSRDGNIISSTNSEKEESSRGSNNSERSVLVPKTLRIDDPSEAAKSSIWATLGIKNEKTNSGEGLFKGFQSKRDDRNYTAETSAVLQANPAALSRSLNFRENT